MTPQTGGHLPLHSGLESALNSPPISIHPPSTARRLQAVSGERPVRGWGVCVWGGADRQTSQASDRVLPCLSPSVSVSVSVDGLTAAAGPSPPTHPEGSLREMRCCCCCSGARWSLSAAAVFGAPPPTRLHLPHLSTDRRRQARRNRSLRYACRRGGTLPAPQ